MGYTHHEGISLTKDGLAVGKKGSEVKIIDKDGNIAIPSGKTITGNLTGSAFKSEARTATADGTGTGQISAGTTFVPVTSANAAHIVTLPAPVPGLEITLQNGATGYEIRSSAPATISINGGAGANAESAVAASTTVVLRCVSATAWIGDTYTAAGVKGVLEVAAP